MRKLIVIAAIVSSSVAYADKPPFVISEVKAFALNGDGSIGPYTQDSLASAVALGIKVTGLRDVSTVPLTFTAVDDSSAAYAEAGKKAPPARKIRVSRQVTLAGSEKWIYLLIDLACYDAMKIELGKVKKSLTPDLLPGSCPV